MRFFLPNSTTSSTIPFSGPIIKFLNTIWIVNSPPPLLRQHEKCMCCKWNEEQVFIKGLDCAVSVILFWGEEEKLEITQMLSRCLPKSTLPAAEPSRRSRLKIGYRAENKTLHLTILANNARSRKNNNIYKAPIKLYYDGGNTLNVRSEAKHCSQTTLERS